MDLVINGKSQQIELIVDTLQGVIDALSISAEGRVIELNGRLFRSSEFVTQGVQSGDKIEIIQFMGGG
jgi:thiazole tautomerase (transcriptional regulator TenI)